MKKVKDEDLILYLYNDCPPRLHALITQALQEDIELQARLKVLQRTIKQLNRLKLKSPSKMSLREVMKYAGSKDRETRDGNRDS